jgi:hypothetical protein
LVVMDGETNNITATVDAYNYLGQLLVNTATNTIYQASSPTLVLNGANNTATSVTVGTGAQAGALNQGTNYIYVANAGSNTVSVINGAVTGPVFSASPNPLAFGNQTQGTTSSPATLTVTNTGTSALTITTVTPGGANMADFPVVSDTCAGATVAAGKTCTVSVEFAPSTTSSESATLTFTDNAAGSPQVVSLTGVGSGAPGAMLNPSPVSFGSTTQPQPVGTSATLPVTLTNTGNAALAIASIQVTPIPSEFTQTNNCGSSLAPAASCTISVTFTPVTAGEATATASLSVTDNAATSPQTIPLTGTVQNFSLTTSCTTLTVVPGQTAIFTVDMAPVNGFTQSVSLGCSGEPALATCTVSPTSMTLDGSTTIQAKVTATTMPATGFLQSPFERLNGNRMAGFVGLGGITGFAALVVLPLKRRVKPGRRLCGLIFLLCLLAAVAILPSCGGGGVDPPGTAAGTYPLTVTGTLQPATGPAITEQVSFNLVVQ